MAEALTKAGRYQIVGELGRGSMGVVYQGFDPVIGRTVAIKTMLPEGLSPQEFEEYKTRFQREAMAAGILAHPNIITVYDFGEDNGVLYLAMEFLEGKSLEKIVQEQTVLPIETILPIYDQVCSALDHAHQNKVVHRDIKPANIMILQNGLVKVTDFGIAKMMAMGMTQAGQILGTPNYMSPEQVKGRQIDGRSDIFSLGVILYELVTGEKPFGGQNITTVIYKIINENPIPPRELDASIHAGLSYVISKALAKSADERYQTCRELSEDLRNYKNLGGSVAGPGTVLLKSNPASVESVEIAHPPASAAQPAAQQSNSAAVDDAPIGSSLNIHVIPPHAPRKQSVPQIAWVLGALVFVAIMGIASYFIWLRPTSKSVVNTPPVPVTTPVVKVGQLNVSANVNGAQISVDDKTDPSWLTPYTIPDLSAGTHNVTVSMGGYQNFSQSVTIEGGKSASLAANLAAVQKTQTNTIQAPAAVKMGQVMVSANVSGARISLNGRSDPGWLTPHTIADLPAGVYNVEIAMDGYDDYRQSVTVVGGQTQNVVGNLSPPSGELDITTVPPGAEIVIDGKSYGPSPVSAPLALGRHTYVVKAPGMAPVERAYTLTSGVHMLKVPLATSTLSGGIVEVRTIPPGATVLADGSVVSGQTPTSFRLPSGTHMLVISLSGYRPIQRQVTVSDNSTTPVNVNLPSQ